MHHLRAAIPPDRHDDPGSLRIALSELRTPVPSNPGQLGTESGSGSILSGFPADDDRTTAGFLEVQSKSAGRSCWIANGRTGSATGSRPKEACLGHSAARADRVAGTRPSPDDLTT